MKLLLVGPYPVRNNGMSKYIAQYRAEFLRQGHAVDTERMYFWREKWRNGRWLSLRARLREGFDAVLIQHTPTASGPLLPLFLRAARRSGVRTVVVGHEPPSVYAKHLPPFLRGPYHAYERAVFDGASARIVHTGIHARELRDIGVKNPIEMIPHPVFKNEVSEAIDASASGSASPAAASPFDASPGPATRDAWGYFGMISPKKGVDLLLEAYQSRPPGHFPPLRILGEAAPGNERYLETLKTGVKAEFRDRIRFLGYVEDSELRAEFARWSLVILPYRWVSQSGALAHACLYRVPYLASDLPFFRDFREAHGCGRLFPEGSVEGLAQAMEEVLEKPMLAEERPFEALARDLSLESCAEKVLKVITDAAPD